MIQPIRPSLTTFVRAVSTNSKQRCPSQVLSTSDYYQKIGYGALENQKDDKPEGWDSAKPFTDIPGPKPLPLIGNSWRFFPGGEFFNVELLDFHTKMKAQYGNIAYLTGIPGKRPVLFSYDPDDMEQTLRNEGTWPIRYGLPSFVYYRTRVRQNIFQGVGGTLTVQGEDWFKFRSVVNKILMQPRTAEMYVYSMDEVANGLIQNIRKMSRDDPKREMPEDFQNEIFKWTLDSIGVIAFNKRIGCLDQKLEKNSEGQQLIDASAQVMDLLYKLDILPSLWPIISTRKWRRFVKNLDCFTEISLKYIDECMANANPDPTIPDHERSVLERLAKNDRKIALAMTTDMLIAGIDTTGRTMASALYYLAKNPDKQTLLRNELKTYLPSKNAPVSKEMLRESPYLKAVIKETTRLAPVSIGILRTSIKDTVLSGYQIPKGTDVVVVNMLTSRDEKYFKRADEFIPERWLRTSDDEELSYKNVHPFVYLPFGFGPRSCVGKRLANLELEVGLAKVIRNFKLSWNYPDAKFSIKLLYGIADPLRIKMEELED